MSETNSLKLPLILAAQAQKHVTVNEALGRLDGMVQLRIVSQTTATPPSNVVDGAVYAVPAGASGTWAGQDGRLALGQNGGWVYTDPQDGWQGWDIETGCPLVYRNGGWASAVVSHSANGASAGFRTITFDHDVASAEVSTTNEVIPANAMIFAVSARVLSPLTGSASSWRLGDPGQDDRFGAGLGLAQGSYATGILGTPMTVYADTPIVVTATGGAFSGGSLRIAAHVFEISLPHV